MFPENFSTLQISNPHYLSPDSEALLNLIQCLGCCLDFKMAVMGLTLMKVPPLADNSNMMKIFKLDSGCLCPQCRYFLDLWVLEWPPLISQVTHRSN